jgi:hypothetical protein
LPFVFTVGVKYRCRDSASFLRHNSVSLSMSFCNLGEYATTGATIGSHWQWASQSRQRWQYLAVQAHGPPDQFVQLSQQ